METELLPEHFEKYETKIQDSILKYLQQLDPIEHLAYKIGKTHLGSSYNILKSNGYIDWIKKNKT
jgi:hypothetical protein